MLRKRSVELMSADGKDLLSLASMVATQSLLFESGMKTDESDFLHTIGSGN